MKTIFGAIIAASLLAAPPLQAAGINKIIGGWTCEDFLALKASSRPIAVGYAHALHHKDKADEAVLNVNDIETLTPVIYQSCSKNPQQNFTARVHQEWDKFKKHL